MGAAAVALREAAGDDRSPARRRGPSSGALHRAVETMTARRVDRDDGQPGEARAAARRPEGARSSARARGPRRPALNRRTKPEIRPDRRTDVFRKSGMPDLLAFRIMRNTIKTMA
ncbi:hypothetical protein BVI1335_2270011 [Burkholderia vietnamiensis]|nr:hypothetical protein BVI1335_2270011 [Burkholderia vietnamiensis]